MSNETPNPSTPPFYPAAETYLRQHGQTGERRSCAPLQIAEGKIYDPVLGRHVQIRVVVTAAVLYHEGVVVPYAAVEYLAGLDSCGCWRWLDYRLDPQVVLPQLILAVKPPETF